MLSFMDHTLGHSTGMQDTYRTQQEGLTSVCSLANAHTTSSNRFTYSDHVFSKRKWINGLLIRRFVEAVKAPPPPPHHKWTHWPDLAKQPAGVWLSVCPSDTQEALQAKRTSHNREDNKIERCKFCYLDICQTSATRENYHLLQTLSGLIRQSMAEYQFICHCTNRELKGVREYK